MKGLTQDLQSMEKEAPSDSVSGVKVLVDVCKRRCVALLFQLNSRPKIKTNK